MPDMDDNEEDLKAEDKAVRILVSFTDTAVACA
jgi:hypothetical protein